MDFLFPERTYRIPALLAVETHPSVPQLCKLPSPDLLTGQDAGKQQIEYGCLVIHAAGRDAENGDQFGVGSFAI